jgi:hypothetical protein
VVKKLDLPVGSGVTPKDWVFDAPHHGLDLSEDGHTICIAGRASDYAALVRAPELTLIATGPGRAIRPAGRSWPTATASA